MIMNFDLTPEQKAQYRELKATRDSLWSQLYDADETLAAFEALYERRYKGVLNQNIVAFAADLKFNHFTVGQVVVIKGRYDEIGGNVQIADYPDEYYGWFIPLNCIDDIQPIEGKA